MSLAPGDGGKVLSLSSFSCFFDVFFLNKNLS